MSKYDLIVEIRVPLVQGCSLGTGYPVAENRILTARHIVCPPDRDMSKPIKVSWYYKGLSAEATVEWCGQGGLDLAVLDCPFPETARDWRGISTSQPTAKSDWETKGFARAAHQRDGCRPPTDLQGKVYGMADAATTFNVDVRTPVDTDDDWSGASGSPVFLGESIIGVIVRVPQKLQSAQLTAVALGNLIPSDSSFCNAIKLDETRQNAARANLLQTRVANLLKKAPFAVSELCAEFQVDDVTDEARAEALAGKLLRDCRIEDLLPKSKKAFRSLNLRGEQKSARAIHEILQIIVPAIFEIARTDEVRAKLSNVKFWLLECPSSTKTVAEIIMAGADGREALMVPPSQTGDLPHGQYLLCREPECGIDVAAPQFQRDFRDHLINLFASDISKSKRLEWGPKRVKARLQNWAGEKTYYFIVDIPEDAEERCQINDTIRELKEEYPHIAFLVLDTEDEDLYLRETSLFDPFIDIILSGTEEQP
ncbi:MAG: hypothetical protein GVY13_14675 [Alphaproteobacteria bacterium]|jgi:hypothetical protein|nr:hypothetical protein [Alphaproteobacteria bacterium]